MKRSGLKYSICTIMFCIISLISLAQARLDETYYQDSLLKEAAQTHNTTERAQAYLALCDFYFIKDDSINMRRYLAEAKKDIGDNNGFLHDALSKYDADLYYNSNPDTAISMYMVADSKLAKYTTKAAYFIRSRIWSRVAALKQLKDDDNAFLETVVSKSMPLANKSEDSARISAVYFDVGIALYNTLDYRKSNEYLYRAVKVLDNTPIPYRSKPDAYIQIAKNYIMLEKYDSAKYILNIVYPLISKFPNSIITADYYHINGMYLYKVKDYKNSIISLDKGIAIAQELNKPYLAYSIYARKFNFYFEQKKYKEALHVLDENSKNATLTFMVRNRMSLVYNYSRVLGAMGKYKMAYDSLSRFLDIFDSLTEADFYNKTRQLEAKFNVAQKEHTIAKLEAEKKQNALKSKNQKLTSIVLATTSALLLLAAAFLFFYYKNTKKLVTQKELNHQQQLKKIEQEQELKITQAMLEGEERERQRMARDLHDGLGGMLAGVKMNLSRQSKMEHQNLDAIIDQLDNSVSELRRIARNMMPESLLKIGLEAAVRDLCESLSGERTDIEFQPYNISTDISSVTQANIYRIVQELLSNAIRHADATKIILQCSQNESHFLITAEDNGKGFDIDKLKSVKGIGFSNIQNRVEYLKGNIDISSVPNEGTTINVELNV